MCLIIFISVWLYKPKIDDSYINEASYPVQACDFIIENIDLENMRIFNEYNYGSYLLFRGIPVFIDSRADLYTPEFNKDVNVFQDFINTSNINNYYENMFEKYDITHVLLYKNSKLNMFLSRDDNYQRSIENENSD